MPKESQMAQISRPFQIGLAAVVLLAGVWLFALKGGSSSSHGTSAAPSGSAPPPATSSKSGSASASESGPTAPGVAGLTRAIEKAHGAVKTSEQNARQLEQKSQEASSSSVQSAGGTSAAVKVTSTSVHTSSATKSHAASSVHVHRHSVRVSTSQQKAVEAELRAGKVVVLLFWDRKGADDLAVHGAVQAVAGHGVAVHSSSAGQVAAYGTVTRGVQVYGTPTVLVIGRSGKANVITGLTDEYSLRQAISEARKS
jgi:hypothetical protein